MMGVKRRDAQKGKVLRAVYDKLLSVYGPQHWWPAETPFEVCVGAILTQNTNWKNVEKAIENLRQAPLLSCQALDDCPEDRLARFLKPAGYFNIKARRLKNFVGFLKTCHGGSLKSLGRLPWPVARAQLLSVNGIGNETADSILLYALNKPVFVIDAYTKRLLLRHGFGEDARDYASMQGLFMSCLDPDPDLYNEYHALIVQWGKEARSHKSNDILKDRKYFL